MFDWIRRFFTPRPAPHVAHRDPSSRLRQLELRTGGQRRADYVRKNEYEEFLEDDGDKTVVLHRNADGDFFAAPRAKPAPKPDDLLDREDHADWGGGHTVSMDVAALESDFESRPKAANPRRRNKMQSGETAILDMDRLRKMGKIRDEDDW